jgi:hypothetical protein
MSRKNNHNKRSNKPVAKSSTRTVTSVRNTAIPKTSSRAAHPARKTPTWEMIAVRAYEISQSPLCGSEIDNWLRAENELRG